MIIEGFFQDNGQSFVLALASGEKQYVGFLTPYNGEYLVEFFPKQENNSLDGSCELLAFINKNTKIGDEIKVKQFIVNSLRYH